jgi:hypothetical protein
MKSYAVISYYYAVDHHEQEWWHLEGQKYDEFSLAISFLCLYGPIDVAENLSVHTARTTQAFAHPPYDAQQGQ